MWLAEGSLVPLKLVQRKGKQLLIAIEAHAQGNEVERNFLSQSWHKEAKRKSSPRRGRLSHSW